MHEIIYEADTPQGKLFDVILLILILASIVLVMLESVESLRSEYGDIFQIGEWIITIFFTLEYFARIITVNKPKNYIFSFYGIIDFISTIPLYLSFFIVGSNALLTFRALRLLRVFRILKVTRYIGESNKLTKALVDSKTKISVFLFTVLIICIISGTVMYLVEGKESGFTNIPVSIYWCIVTLTTVGYGDIHPITPLGQFLASIIMIMGYGIIAVPTGIVSAEYTKSALDDTSNQDEHIHTNTQSCSNCNHDTHHDHAKFCNHCGYSLDND
ncbi:ion transporter [uncultured Dokdonia sp.]|uniref:ion transporter n=1 Tax=uncultured Dokdonia sp. TaxID=575653 RepID=UPI002612713C|nr:ion transporter [uncultured Dokdonia sp.]